MAGYFLYTFDNDVFTQLTTSPTEEQGLVLADSLLEYFNEEELTSWDMGFTALDGLPMGTRCGALGPGVPLYLMGRHGLDARAWRSSLLSSSGARRHGAGSTSPCTRLLLHPRTTSEVGC